MEKSDELAVYSNQIYSKAKHFSTPRTHGIRFKLVAKNIVSHEHKFFCNKPSDRNIVLTVSFY